MPTIDDALKIVERDPVAGYVMIPIIAAAPPREGLVVSMRGHQVLLPVWSAEEWLWYGGLAFGIASRLETSSAGRVSRERAVERHSKSMSLVRISQSVGEPLSADMIARLYTDSVKLVIEAVAGADAPSRGRLVAESIREAVIEAPSTILAALNFAITQGGDRLLLFPKTAAELIGKLFGAAASGLGAGLGIGTGTIVLIAVGLLWYFSRRKE